MFNQSTDSRVGSERELPELGQPPDNKNLIALAACNKMKMQNCVQKARIRSRLDWWRELNPRLYCKECYVMYVEDMVIHPYLFNKLTVILLHK